MPATAKGMRRPAVHQRSTGLTLFVITSIVGCVAKGIQSELKQSKPFESLESEAIVALLRTADLLDWRITEALKPFEVSPTQYNCLRILRGAGPAGLTCSEVGERMINRDPDITRLIDRLEKRGLVKRSRERKDRRVIITQITPAGLDLLKSCDRPLESYQGKLLGPLGESKLQSLLATLDAARELLR